MPFPPGLRIGSVPYLNAKPLHGDIAGIQLEHPSRLAAQLRSGELDAALVPVVEVLENPVYDLVAGVGIACIGPVYSVVLCHRAPLAEMRSAAVDSASRTSVELLRIVLRCFLRLEVELLPQGSPTDAQLWIGDQAIAYRHHHPDEPCLDLGEAWVEHTGLPFVFALWALRRRPANDAAAAEFRRAARNGLAGRRTIACGDAEFRYLTENIHYHVGAREREGLQRFSELLAATGRIPEPPELRWI